MATDIRIIKAMILAAGEGTRLSPLTAQTPKVLLELGGKPLICHTLNWLKSHSISQVVINIHHLGERIKDFLGDGSSYGLKISYSEEQTLLGTAGGVKKMESFFDGTFVVIYGDILTDFDLSAMIRFHQKNMSVATLALWEVANTWEVGIVQMDSNGMLKKFIEKPSKGSGFGNLASGGIYVMEKEILSTIPGHSFCDFAYDVFPRLIDDGMPIYGYALGTQDYLIDIGTHEKYRQADNDVKEGKLRKTDAKS